MKLCVLQAVAELRPDAVALVDSFGFDDYELNSTIGRCGALHGSLHVLCLHRSGRLCTCSIGCTSLAFALSPSCTCQA